MRGLLCFSLLAGLLLGSKPVSAETSALPQIKLKVGEVYSLQLEWVLVRYICDDDDLVAVEDGGDHLRVVGKAPGRTTCGFWRDIGSPTPAVAYDVVVTAAPPPKR